MAINARDINYSNQDRVVILQADQSSTEYKLSDLNMSKLGTNRNSEILGKAGYERPFQQEYNVYLNSL